MASSAELSFAIRAVNEASRTLRDVQGDIERIGDHAERSRGPLGGMGDTLRNVGTIAAGVFSANVLSAGVSAVTGFVGGAVNAAKDLGESLNAVNVVFGDSARKILDWGQKNATAFGLSSREFNQLVTPLGAMLQNYGFSADEAANQSIELAKRAADMASVFNVDVGEALGAIQAGLRGEADPLEKFGVGLNAAAIESKALAMTGKDVASSLTDQEKKAASLALIMEQTSDVQGDFASTSGELANSQRIAAAKTEELQAKLGEKLLPVTLLITQAKLKLTEAIVNQVIPAVERMLVVFDEEIRPVLEDVAAVVQEHLAPAFVLGLQTIQDALTPVVQFIVDNKPILIAAITAIGVGILIALGPGAVAIAAIVGLITVLGLVRENWDAIKAKVQEVLDDITARIPAFNVISDVVTYVAGIVEDQVGDIIDYIQSIITVAEEVISFFNNVFKGDWEAAWQDVKDIATGILNLFLDYLQLGFLDEIVARLVAAAPVLLQKGQELLGAIWDGFKRYWDDVVYWYYVGFPLLVLNTIGDVLTTLYPKGFELLKGLLDGAQDFYLNTLLPWWAGLPLVMLGALGDLSLLLLGAGRQIVAGLKQGIAEAWDGFIDWLWDKIAELPGVLLDFFGITSPSRLMAEIGGNLVLGLALGMKDRMEDIWRAIREVRLALLSTIDEQTRQMLLDELRKLIEDWNAIIGGAQPLPGIGVPGTPNPPAPLPGGLPPNPPPVSGGLPPGTPPAEFTGIPANWEEAVNTLLGRAGAFDEFWAITQHVPTMWTQIARDLNHLYSSQGGMMAVLRDHWGLTGPMGAFALYDRFAVHDFMETLRQHGLAFRYGGVVPGPLGMERLALVHGGERITAHDSPRWQQQMAPIVHINISAIDGASVQRIAPQLAAAIRKEWQREMF